MTLPFVLHIGSLVIEPHLVFELLAYFIGFRYYLFLRNRNDNQINEDKNLTIIIGGVLGAAFLSKLLGYFEHPELLTLSKQNITYILASKTIVGGLLGGLWGVEIAKKFCGVKRSTGDLFCFPVILGIMIGRIGCFLTGVSDGTWGSETSSVFGMDGGDGVLRHPAALYEIAMLGFIWLLLLALKRKLALQEGALFKIFMILYLLWRFCIEFIKPVYLIQPIGISAIQLACLIGLVYYRKVILKPRNLVR